MRANQQTMWEHNNANAQITSEMHAVVRDSGAAFGLALALRHLFARAYTFKPFYLPLKLAMLARGDSVPTPFNNQSNRISEIIRKSYGKSQSFLKKKKQKK